MFDAAANSARELLSLFGKNTAVSVVHKYGTNTMFVVVARTGNTIATITKNSNGIYSIGSLTSFDLEDVAQMIMSQRSFPKPRNMKRSWSPIRLSESAKAELDIRRATMNGYFV